jgi:hypothetical protein
MKRSKKKREEILEESELDLFSEITQYLINKCYDQSGVVFTETQRVALSCALPSLFHCAGQAELNKETMAALVQAGKKRAGEVLREAAEQMLTQPEKLMIFSCENGEDGVPEKTIAALYFLNPQILAEV